MLKKSQVKYFVENILIIALGGFIYVVGVEGILVPHRFLNGGLVGISLIIKYLFPALGLGVIYALLNIPLFILGWFNISRRFVLFTGFGIAVFSVLADLLDVQALPVTDPMLAVILAGIICGFGGGIVFRTAGSLGGLDILTAYLYNRFDLRQGFTSFLVNMVILSAGALLFNLEMALYTFVFVFIQSRVTDAVITGFNRRKSIIVISDRSREIGDSIMNDLGRGVTFLEGWGGHSGQEKRVIFSVITLLELGRLKSIVFTADPEAFLVVNDTLDVVGSTLGQRKLY
ncbi:MAG: YitT family protein [Proteobacteria bacterium]|nr:YitT family protein [Pseudomonadota bacterium]